MDPRSLRVIQNAYFSLLTHTKQLLAVSFCDDTAGIGAELKCDIRMDRKETEMRFEKVIQIMYRPDGQ